MSENRQGMTAAEHAMAGYVAHAFSHAVQSLGPPTQYGPGTISLAKGAIAHLEREGFFVRRVDAEVHDHCDRDPGECSYEAFRGEHEETQRRLDALAVIVGDLGRSLLAASSEYLRSEQQHG